MARISPFRGIVFHPEKIPDLSAVTTPPYDVISPEEQEHFYAAHPCNIIRLVLGKKSEKDTAEENPHSRAASFWKQWQADGFLKKDEKPAFYATAIAFGAGEPRITRYGLIAMVGLESFEKKVILPHEKTFSKVKTERLELMKASYANFCPIFSLFPDPENSILPCIRAAITDREPDSEFRDTAGHGQKMWRITDEGSIRELQARMKDKKLFIADGHHRYETALNFRKWLQDNDPDFSDTHPANYVMMYLASMQDPGMVILPAHRMLKEIAPAVMETFLSKAGKYFQIRSITCSAEKDLQTFTAAMEAGEDRHTIGLCMKNRQELFLLTLQPGVMQKLFSEEIPDSLLNLDVTVLTRMIFMEILEFDQERLDNHNLISYATEVKKAVEGVWKGDYDMSFILNHTKIEQVRQVAEEGLIMPRKSTYFYPKVITGQVMNSLKS